MRTDPSFDAPQQVIGNIRFTRGGVYADYLLDGLSVTMRTLAAHNHAALLTRNLGRMLPSASQLSGLLVPDDQNQIMRRIVGTHHHRPDWIPQCRAWQPVIARPAPLLRGGYQGPVHRRYWLTIPVDAGKEGRTAIGQAQRIWDWVAGRDHDSDDSVQRYRDLGEEIVSALPDEFHITAATPAQILWHRQHQLYRGVVHQPIPPAGDGPTSLSFRDFPRAAFDEGANAIRPRWWPTRWPLVRIYNPDDPHGPVSYQTILVVDDFPRSGLRFTKAAYLHALDNVATAATIDWVQHLTVRTPEQAQAINETNAKNLRDQYTQRDARHPGDTVAVTLDRQLQGTESYTREISNNPTEREIDASVLIAVGGESPEVLREAVKLIRQELDTTRVSVKQIIGGQAQLWKAFNPGSETTAPITEFRDPTTAHRWSRFMPLISDRVGNATGSPLAVNQTTLRPSIILHDPEGAARRNHNTGRGVVGEPGSGKSNRVKLSAIECVWRGSRIVVFDPGPLKEWRKAFRRVPGAVAIDPTNTQLSVDPLRIFPHEEAADYAADHVLPLIGVPNRSLMQAQFSVALRPDLRTANGIRSMRGLIEYLRRQPHPESNELLIRLEAAAASTYTQALFDATRPPYRPSDAPATIWLTHGLALPDAEDIKDPEKYRHLKLRHLAGMAIYGLLIDIEQKHMFAHPEQYSEMIFEEAAELLAYPAGARTAHTITLQGRKYATGLTVIVQDYRHIAAMGDKFVTQKWLFRITDPDLAEDTLRWAHIDPDLYPDLVDSYATDTSPADTRETSDGDIGHGQVPLARRGEGFIVDEFRCAARCKYLQAPTDWLADDLDSTPPQENAA